MRDKREALKKGTKIEGGGRVVQVEEEVGRGANCIVYNAFYKDRIGVVHKIRLKECYPAYLLLNRKEDGSIHVFEGEEEKYEAEKNYFVQAYKKNADVRNIVGITNSTINSTDLISCNHTNYILMNLDEGIDYRKYEDTSLKELLEHVKSLSELIMKYHQNGYLHLDIKPENIFILPETEEHILLFDFDSVTKVEELRQNGGLRLSFSEEFSAPEQIQGKIDKIGTHTDIYSIGALLFYKLFHRSPDTEDCRISSGYSFEEMKYSGEKYQPRLFRTLELFFKKTLSIAIVSRWNDMKQVLDKLDELIRLADVEGTYLIHSFQYNGACFVGREEEIEKIHSTLAKNQLIFLSGIGGIGKTEIVRQYANRYQEQYDTILFTVFEKSIELLVCDEIMINGIEREEEESDRDYFRRKIDILKHIATPRDLILIDNFDVEEDEDLELLFQCPCKFIITTRKDFRDFNYPQIIIEEIKNQNEILKLFSAYNAVLYSDDENEAVQKLINFVDRHTMTVELIAKYLRNTQSSPKELYQRFLEKEGITNTEEISVKQRKDHRLRAKSINGHLRILFDLSGFDDSENEIISSLSLFAGIRIKKARFAEICGMENVRGKLEVLIGHGWIMCDEISDKIYLHQVVQDLIYKDLAPDASKCLHVVEGMIRYMTETDMNYTERRIRSRVLEIFMDRLQGDTLSYTKLCLLFGKKEKLMEAEKILAGKKEKERFDILQKIYRKWIKILFQMDDVFESDLELDDYIRLQYVKMTELLEKGKECCLAYTDSPDYLAAEFVDMGSEADHIMAENILFGYSDEVIPELDAYYRKIIELFDFATEKIPDSSYDIEKKEELYMRIREFYADDFTVMYRCEHFSDMEKAYWYQEQIDLLHKDTSEENSSSAIHHGAERRYFSSSGITYDNIADEYREKGEYEKAIQWYTCAYTEGWEPFESAMEGISQTYVKMGRLEQAAESLEQILIAEKKVEQDPKAYVRYSKSVCLDLIKLLIKQKHLEKARHYANELIHYCEQDWEEDDNEYETTYLLAGWFCLYQISEDQKERECVWKQCLKYFSLLDGCAIDKAVYEFVEAYVRNTETACQDIDQILERMDTWEGKSWKKSILLDVVKRLSHRNDCREWHVLFLVKLAEISNSYPDEDAAEALEYCDMAQKCLEQYGLKDEYISSLLCHVRSEIMSSDPNFEYDQKIQIKKKCNYELLAERKICKSPCSEEEKIEIWRDAAGEYRYIDDFEKEILCLRHAVAILNPILNKFNYSRFDRNYCYIMDDLVRACIRIDDRKSALNALQAFYSNGFHFMFEMEKEEGGRRSNRFWWMRRIAEFLEEANEREASLKMYMAVIYLEVEKVPDIDLIRRLFMTDGDLQKISDRILMQVKRGVDREAIDTIVDLSEKISGRMNQMEYPDKYNVVVNLIREKYQHQDIEFKKI